MSMTREKISIIAPNLSGNGGTETVLTLFMSGLKIKARYEMTLYLPDKVKDRSWINRLESLDINVVENVAGTKFGRILTYFKVGQGIQIALGANSGRILKVINKFRRGKSKVVSWIHFSLDNVDFVNEESLKKLDYHFAISTDIKNQLIRLGIPDARIFTIFNPLTMPKEIIRRSNDDVTRIAYVGRLQLKGQKNVSEFIQALSLLPDNQKFEVSIVGDGVDKSDLMIQAERSLTENVKISWLGWQSEPWSKLPILDAVVSTSTYEGLSMTLGEALSLGVPVIASNVPAGMNDLIVSGDNGYLYELGNTKQLSEYIASIRNFAYTSHEVSESVEWLSLENYENRVLRSLKEMEL